MIAIQIISEGSSITTFRITSSPRNKEFLYRAGYISFASSHCPEFTGDCLYVFGESTANDDDPIEVPNEFMPKLLCAIAEVNANKFNVPAPTRYASCCNHLYIDEMDCACNFQNCQICDTSSNRRDMREVVSGENKYYICKTHKKTIKCTVCNEKTYFVVPHATHAELQVCPDCRTANVVYGHQHYYSHKPMPLFHDFVGKAVKIFSYDEVLNNTLLNKKYWTGHEVEQQFPYESNRGILIGTMEQKQGGLIYCKHDGSIGNGTECVTHPFSWEFFKQHDWDGILNHHLVDWRTSGNQVGQHTHININAFTRMHLFKFLQFHHTHLKWVEFVSQRSLLSYCRPTGGSIQKALNRGVSCEKYEFIHVTRNTIEWRAFGSPITIEEFKKNNEYLHASFNWTLNASRKELTVENLIKYIQQHRRDYPNLLHFIETFGEAHPQRFLYNKEQDYHKITTKEQRASARQRTQQGQMQSYTCYSCEMDFTGIPFVHDGALFCPTCYSEIMADECYDECDED